MKYKKILSKFKPKSDFTRNVLILLTGTTIAQVIPIVISPILTRLYTPEDFGVLALFISITSILGNIASGRYELAIMLPKKDGDAINIATLGIFITTVFSFILLLIILFFHSYILNLLNNKEISPWLYSIPLVVFLTGLYNVLNYWNNRKKHYKNLAKASILKSVVGSIIQLILGFFKVGATGLISGQIISQMFVNGILLKNLIKEKVVLKKLNKSKIIILGKKYKNFPLYSMPSGVINTLSLQLPILILSKYFDIKFIGMFSLSQRVLSLPISFIGSSVGQVFFQKASVSNAQELQILIINTIRKLFFLGLIPFSILLVYGDLIFSFIFGKNWLIAGYISQILSVWLFIVFCVSPVSIIYDIKQKQKEALIFNILLVIGRAGALILGAVFIKEFLYTIILYAMVGTVLWIGNALYILSLVNVNISIFYKEFIYFFLVISILFLFREVIL